MDFSIIGDITKVYFEDLPPAGRFSFRSQAPAPDLERFDSRHARKIQRFGHANADLVVARVRRLVAEEQEVEGAAGLLLDAHGLCDSGRGRDGIPLPAVGFRITDLEGQQVSDLVVFVRNDPTERLSQDNTRKLNNTWLLSTGHRLHSTKCRSLLTIVADTVGRHDLQSSACSPYDYPIRFGIHGPSCQAILAGVLAPYGIPEHLIPDPFNVFMHTTVDESGSIHVHPPRSQAGDYIEFRADFECLVGMTVCPQDQNACNGYRITPLGLTIYEAG